MRKSKYDGAKLRAIRAVKGVGRPPKKPVPKPKDKSA
jgi:hypothetical protein